MDSRHDDDSLVRGLVIIFSHKELANLKKELHTPWKREVVIAPMFRGSDVKYPTTQTCMRQK